MSIAARRNIHGGSYRIGQSAIATPGERTKKKIGPKIKTTAKYEFMIKMKCNECGATFKKKVGPKTYEVKCPKCGGYDTEIGESYLMSKDGKTLYQIKL